MGSPYAMDDVDPLTGYPLTPIPQADKVLRGLAQGVVDSVKTPGAAMRPNPYQAGSEEAAWYDQNRQDTINQWSPGMALGMMGVGTPFAESGALGAFGGKLIKTDNGTKINIRPENMELPEWGKDISWGATAYRGKRLGQDAIYIRDTRLPPSAQGQGASTAMYEHLAKQAHSEGLPFQSDSTVTNSATNTWAALKRLGYDVKTAPQDKLVKLKGPPEAPELSRHETTDGSPVFWIDPKITKADGGSVFDPDEFSSFKASKAQAPSSDFDPAEFSAFKSAAATAPATQQAPTQEGPVTSAVHAAAPYLDMVPIGGSALSMAARNFSPEYLKETAKNVPGSAVRFAKDIVQPIIHPVDTATSIKNLGLGVLEKTGLVSGDEHEKYADAVGSYFASRYGGIENAKKAFKEDPVGVAGDLSMLLTGGETALGRVPGVVGNVARAAGDVGRAVDPLRAVSPVATLAGKGASEALGVTTGVGKQPIEIAGRAGYEGGQAAEAFRENLRGAAPLEEAVDDARKAVQQMRVERGNAYRQQMGPIKADSTVLDFNKIDQAVAGAQGVKTYRGRSGMSQEQILSPKTEAIRTEMEDAIERWRSLDPAEFHTPEGIDALKQQLGNIRDATQYGTPDRVVADRIYNAVRQTIVDQVPQYARVMKGYEEASNQIKEIERTLSVNPKASIDTALRKLQSTLRDNVNTSFGHRAQLIQFLVNSGAPHLMEKLAGQALAPWASRGLARLGAVETVAGGLGALGAGATGAGLAALGTLPTMSPRLVGEVAHGVGRAARQAERTAPALRASRFLSSPFDSGVNPYAP